MQVLKWSVSEDRKALRLNGEDFYGSEVAKSSHGFPTSQVAADTSLGDIHSNFNAIASPPRPMLCRTTYRKTPAADGTKDELVDLNFAVKSLGKEPVHGADGLTLRILKDEEGRLAIADIVTVPADNSKGPKEDNQPPPPTMEHKEDEGKNEEPEKTFQILPIHPMIHSSPNGASACEGRSAAFCRFMALFKARVAAMHNAIQAAKASHYPALGPAAHHRRPCPGKMAKMAHHQGPPHHGPPGIKGGIHKFKVWIFRFGPHNVNHVNTAPPAESHGEMIHSHEHPHHYHGIHRAVHAVHHVFFGFVIPVLIGVAAGMTASLLGMVVGTGIAMLWFKIRRGGRRGNASNATVEGAKSEVALGDEKIALMENERESFEEAPPVYEDKA